MLGFNSKKVKNNSKYILYLFPFLVWIIVYFGFSFDGLYGQDAYEYLRYTEALKTFLTTGKSPGDYFWGVYYPIFGSILSFIVLNIALALQLTSVVSLVVASIYLDKIIRLIYKESTLENIPFLFFTLSSIVLIHSILVMSDMLSCGFITIAVFYILQYLETGKNNTFLLGFSFGILAILTRYASAVILFPFCLLAIVQLIKKRNYLLLVFSILITALIAAPHILIRSQNSLQFLSHQWLQAWNITNLLSSNFITVDGEMHYHFINLIYAFFPVLHPIFMVFGIFLLGYFIKNRNFTFHKYQKLILISILLYALFLGGIPFQNKRFLLLSFPLVIAFLFPLIKKIITGLEHQKLVFILVLLIQIVLGLFFGKSFYDRNVLEKSIIQEMKSYQGNTLYVFDIDIAMKGRKLDLDYKNLSRTKYPDFKKNALVLVNEKQLNKQWKGKNPLVNWENIKNKFQLKKLKKFHGDFNLYRIGEKK